MNDIKNMRIDYLQESTPEVYDWLKSNNVLKSHLEACNRQYQGNLQLYENTYKGPFAAREMAQAELLSNYLGEVGDYEETKCEKR